MKETYQIMPVELVLIIINYLIHKPNISDYEKLKINYVNIQRDYINHKLSLTVINSLNPDAMKKYTPSIPLTLRKLKTVNHIINTIQINKSSKKTANEQYTELLEHKNSINIKHVIFNVNPKILDKYPPKVETLFLQGCTPVKIYNLPITIKKIVLLRSTYDIITFYSSNINIEDTKNNLIEDTKYLNISNKNSVKIQPPECCRIIEDKLLQYNNTYVFNLNPNAHKPSGSINISRVESTQFIFKQLF